MTLRPIPFSAVIFASFTIAKRLDISGATLGNWIKQIEVDEGIREGQTMDEREKLILLRKQNKVLANGT